MLEILTVLSGLILGPMEVELRVPPQTVRVEVRLQDRLVAVRNGPPWRVIVPFPEAPEPMILTVAAFDRSGRAAERIESFVNLDRESCSPPASGGLGATPFVIEAPESSAEVRVSDLAGRFRAGERVLDVLAVEQGPARVLVVKDEAIQDVLDRMSASFLMGQSGGGSVSTKRAWQKLREEYLEIGTEYLARFDAESTSTATASRVPNQAALPPVLESWRELFVLDVPGTLQFIGTTGPSFAHLDYQTSVYPRVGIFDAGESGILWHLRDALLSRGSERIADAVALAGQRAAASCGRRMVLLLESAYSRDSSKLAAEEASRYLRALQVPLVVLRDLEHLPSGEPAYGRWDPTFSVQPGTKEVVRPPLGALAKLHAQMESVLKRQRVVWLAGSYLPEDIEFDAPEPGDRVSATVGEGGAR